jgi:hypothetical protein
MKTMFLLRVDGVLRGRCGDLPFLPAVEMVLLFPSKSNPFRAPLALRVNEVEYNLETCTLQVKLINFDGGDAREVCIENDPEWQKVQFSGPKPEPKS